MSWEDDEILEFEKLKHARARGEELMRLRETMRREQCQARWIALQGEMRSLVVTFNQKAGHSLLRTLGDFPTELRIRREDNAEVSIKFNQALYKVTVEYPSCPGHNRTYVLWVMPINGNEAAMWVSQRGNETQPDQVIAAQTIRTLLRCGL